MKSKKMNLKEMGIELYQDLHIFFRIIREYVFPYFPLVALSIVFSILVAACFGGSIGFLKPIMDNLFEVDGYQKIVHHEYLEAYAPSVSKWVDSVCNAPTQAEQGRNLFTLLLVSVILILILEYFFKFWEEYLIGKVVEHVSCDLSRDLYAHLQKMDIGYINSTGVTRFLSSFTNDILYVNKGIKTLFGKIIGEPLKAIFTIALAFWLNFWMAMIAFTVVPFIFIFIYFVSRRVKKHTKSYLKRRGNLVSLTSDTLYGSRVVQVFCMEEVELKRFQYENEKTYQSNVKILFYDALSTPLIVISTSLVGGIAVWYVGLEVLNKQISAGSFFAFYAAMGALSDPVRKLSNVFTRIQGAIVASRNIFDILDTPSKIQDPPHPLPLSSFSESIEFKNVSFSYGSSEQSVQVLKNINLKVLKGEKVALVGRSGAGKSTFVNLIPRFYDCLTGAITIDGINIKEVKLKDLRRLIGIVTQETLLFNSTIYENIQYGSTNASRETVIEASKKANVHEFVIETEKQYDTMIGEQGIQLSGGQRQRLSITRAILKDPQILILDEAASSLDTINEQKIIEALDQFMVNRTTFVIAHRLSTVVNADKIVVLKEGQIVGVGTHSELLQNNSDYQELYQKQFSALSDTKETSKIQENVVAQKISESEMEKE
ncbi:MAG: ABC transporter ATP-binding protein [Planctomycetota bacterium]